MGYEGDGNGGEGFNPRGLLFPSSKPRLKAQKQRGLVTDPSFGVSALTSTPASVINRGKPVGSGTQVNGADLLWPLLTEMQKAHFRSRLPGALANPPLPRLQTSLDSRLLA